MKRDFSRLAEGSFDLLVIGGGIYGAWTALDASLRGLRVALVDKGDWASGTSSVSSKLIHGGLRYLEQGRIGLVRRTLKERSLLSHLAPHMVRPRRFVVPFYRGARRGPFLMRTGLALYDLISMGDRPGGRRLSLDAGETVAAYPFLHPEGLRGAASYGDAVTDDARLTLEVVEAADGAGAAAVSYAEVVEPIFRKGRAGGAVIRDRLGGETVEVAAGAVVNTAGPWVTALAGCRGLAGEVRLSKGVHLVLPSLGTEDAFLFLTRQERRVLFLIPWYGRTLVGTTDTDYTGSPDGLRVSDADREYLFEELRHVLKGGCWSEGDVLAATAGLRTLADEPGRPSHALTREWVLREPVRGLFVSIGGKYTSARVDAAGIVERVLAILGRDGGGPSPTAYTPWNRAPGEPFDAWLGRERTAGEKLGLDPASSESVCRRYGRKAAAIHRLIREDPDLSPPLVDGLPFCRAEAVFAVRSEMACRLTDILRRRVPVMLLSRPDRKVIDDVAALAGPLLGWNEDRRQTEAAAALEVWEGTPESPGDIP